MQEGFYLERNGGRRAPSVLGGFAETRRSFRAAAKTAAFVLKVLPTLPSRPVDWLTPPPVREQVRYPTRYGETEGDLYRPATAGPHPGVVVCLGVVPFDVEHPQVPRLGQALARAGFAALLYWSPAMRDLRLDPGDVEDLASAYDWLIAQPSVDPARSGLIGTCVGGAFALMAAASPRVRDHVSFVGVFAPYSSMRTLAKDIATATWSRGGVREPWAVDPLTRKVYVHSLTAELEPGEAARLRDALAQPDGQLDPCGLSAVGRAIYPLLTALTADQVEAALSQLPPALQARLDAMSPLDYLPDLHAPLVVLMHDRDDPVIPQAESLRLREALAGRAGVHYTEFVMFKHLDPTKVHLHLLPLLRELGRFYFALYPVFRRATEEGRAMPAPSGPGAVLKHALRQERA
jgi:dienelactone hydrolase